MMFEAEWLCKTIYLIYNLLWKKFVRNFLKTFTFMNSESFYFSSLYKGFRILSFTKNMGCANPKSSLVKKFYDHFTFYFGVMM